MRKILDRNELRILNAYLQIDVDTKNLERKIKQNMRNNSFTRPTSRRRLCIAIAAAMMLVAMLGGTVYAATIGAFDRFFGSHETTFYEIIAPVEIYVIDEDIRLEVIAASQFDEKVIVYLSLQDVSGQNRLTPQAWPVLDLPGTPFRSLSYDAGIEMIYFNHWTNTAYFQLEVIADTPMSKILTLPITSIVYDQGFTHNAMAFPVQLTELLTLANINTLAYDTPLFDHNFVLTPNRAGSFPALPGVEDAWISNIAIIDSNLHVQIGTHGGLGGLNFGINLEAPDGSSVFSGYAHTVLLADENLQPIHRDMDALENMLYDEFFAWHDAIPYSFTEMVFPVDIMALAEYSLTFTGAGTGHYAYTVDGDWTVEINTTYTEDQLLTWEGSVTVAEALIKSISITPLGVRVTGGYVELNDIWLNAAVDVSIITTEGVAAMSSNVGWFLDFPNAYDFVSFSRAPAPINVASVSAVIIDGVIISLD